MKILGLVPARGGSKGIPRKNIRLMNGKPLLEYTAKSALAAKSLTRIVLSTEDAEIAEIGEKCGLDVPFMRPKELAQDSTPSFLVVLYTLLTLEEKGEHYDGVCLLQPTNPLRRAEDIDACINLFITSNADSVISVLPVPVEYNPKWVFWKNQDGTMMLSSRDAEPVSQRQILPPAYHRDGSVYVTRYKTIVIRQSLYGNNVQGYEIDPQFSVNIDTEEDWREAEERILQNKSVTAKI